MVKVRNKASGVITELEPEHYQVLKSLDLDQNFEVITPAPVPDEIKKHESKKANKKADPGGSGEAATDL